MDPRQRAAAAVDAMVRSARELQLAWGAACRSAKNFGVAVVEFHKAAWANMAEQRQR